MTLRRVFIAVETSPQVQEVVTTLQDKMRASGVRLRWVKPQNVHFTLRFLGEIPAAQVARAVVATRQAVIGLTPFDVTIAGLGAFPNFDRPQVVWLDTREGGETLERVAAAMDAQLVRAGFASDGKKFRPHLTLGRARDDRYWGDLVRALQQHRDAEIGRLRVDALTVMESHLTSEGPIYTPIEKVPLAQGLN